MDRREVGHSRKLDSFLLNSHLQQDCKSSTISTKRMKEINSLYSYNTTLSTKFVWGFLGLCILCAASAENSVAFVRLQRAHTPAQGNLHTRTAKNLERQLWVPMKSVWENQGPSSYCWHMWQGLEKPFLFIDGLLNCSDAKSQMPGRFWLCTDKQQD